MSAPTLPPSNEQLVYDLVKAVRDEARPNVGISYKHQCAEEDRRMARTRAARDALLAALQSAHEPPDGCAECGLTKDQHDNPDEFVPRASPPPEVDVDMVARNCADALFTAMELLKGPWLHHEATFLPANVCCDYHGQQKFKKVLRQAIEPILQSALTKGANDA